MTGTAGWLLVVGAAVFVAVAFAPASFVFGIKDPEERRAFLARHAGSWRWGQVLFAGGAVISAVGLLVLGVQLDSAVVTAAGAVATVTSLPWAEHCRERALDAERFLAGELPGWHFRVYVWGTLTALGATGLALFGTDLAAWTAWLLVGATAAFTAVWLTAKDLPPFVFYLVTGALGLAAL